MLKSNARVIVLAGAAALAGLGYTLGRRAGSRGVHRGRMPASPPRRVDSSSSSNSNSQERVKPAPTAAEFASEAERISSAPDALDVALDLDGVFDGESESGVQVTARPNEHLGGPLSGDDDDAPAPEDLGRIWLEQATESEHGLGLADTIPDVENLPRPNRDSTLGEPLPEGEDDETTAEYVRRHRISSLG